MKKLAREKVVGVAYGPCLCLAALIFVLAGCGGEPGKEVATKKASKGTIGVSVLTMRNPFFKIIADNIEAEAKKAGYDVIITDGDKKVDEQRRQVQDFIVKKCSAIVLCPTDAVSIGPVIQEANKAGIPVFTADLACLDPKAEVVSHIATDNLAGGKQAGEAMIEALGESGGKVVILHFKKAESCLLRVQGFREVIDAHNKGLETGKIEIVSELPGEGDVDVGYKCTQDALQTTSDLAGIFAINDPSALGARAALEKAGKADQVKIIGFDGQDDGKRAIRDGKIYADPIQHPDQIGQLTVQTILKYFDGEKVEPQQLIPTQLYRKADGEKDPELKKLKK